MSQWRVGLAGSVAACLIGLTAGAQQPPPQQPPQPQAPPVRRPSPPQPKQAQGLSYFEGNWRFTWTGRESPLSSGPRTGTASFARAKDGASLEVAVAGSADASGPYKETGSMAWDAEKKLVTVRERLANGIEVVSRGDWSSPISIRFESDPVKTAGQTIRIKRTYGIVSASSFTVAEEMSIDGGPFVRLGGAVYGKQ